MDAVKDPAYPVKVLLVVPAGPLSNVTLALAFFEGPLGGDGNFIIGLHGKINKTGKMESMSPVMFMIFSDSK